MAPEPSVRLSTKSGIIKLEIIKFRLIPVRSPLLGESKRSNRLSEINFAYTITTLICFFLFLRLLRCFSSPSTLLTSLCVQLADAPTSSVQVSPFGDSRIKGCLPPHRDLSQAATSFIVFLCQGIHHIPLTRFSHIFAFKNVVLFLSRSRYYLLRNTYLFVLHLILIYLYQC